MELVGQILSWFSHFPTGFLVTRSLRATVNTYLGRGKNQRLSRWVRWESHIMYTRGQIGRLSSARPIVPKGSLGTCACTHSLRTLNSNSISMVPISQFTSLLSTQFEDIS